MGPSFVERLPVRKFHDAGPATAGKMARLGIESRLYRAIDLELTDEQTDALIRELSQTSENDRYPPVHALWH
jgi:hypothetical protein